MARLYMTGAEIDAGASTAAQNTGPDGIKAGTGTLTRDTVVFRSGLASFKYDTTGSNLAVSTTAPTPTFTDGVTYYFRAYVRTTATGTTSIIGFGTTGTSPIQVRLTAGGALALFVSSVQVGSASAAINDGNFHLVEVRAVASGGNWTAEELMVDGISVAVGATVAARTNGLVWGWVAAPGASLVLNVDDVALNDSTGTVNNGWCGPGKVIMLLPISDNARSAGWVGGAGGTTNLFDAVNNTPPTGVADTGTNASQIRNATAEANGSYDANMTSYATAGMGILDCVVAVSPVIATAAPVTTSSKQGTVGVVSNPTITNIALGPTGTSGAFWAGATAGTYGAGWKWSLGTMTQYPTVTIATSPVMRCTQVTSSTRIADVCFMGMYVDYVPDAGRGIVGNFEDITKTASPAVKRSAFYCHDGDYVLA